MVFAMLAGFLGAFALRWARHIKAETMAGRAAGWTCR